MEKRGLGRGLSALISDTISPEEASQVKMIPVSQIVPNPYQPRTHFDSEKLEELTASVREFGILQPILLRRAGMDRYELIAGERRFRAACAAGLLTAPALIREIESKTQLEIAVVENLQREDIGPLEAARAYRRLIDEFGMTQETVALRVGKSRSGIANTLRLLQLPESIQVSIERGEISEGHGRAMLLCEIESDILQIYHRVRDHQLSVRDTERLARNIRMRSQEDSGSSFNASTSKSLSPEQNKTIDPNLTSVIEELQQMFGTKVSIKMNSGSSGKIEIEFYSSDDLDRVVDTIRNGRKL